MLPNHVLLGQIRQTHLSDWLIASILFVALFPLTLSPFGYTMLDNHSLGSEAAYDYWAANDFQWGTEIIQNVGPLGFIHFPLSFTGFLDYENALANFALSGTLVVLVIYLSWSMPHRVIKIVFLSLFAVMEILKKPNGFPMPTEVNHYLLMLFTSYALFRCCKYIVVIPLMVLLACMSLGKGMFLFLTPPIVLFTAIHYMLLKKLWMPLVAIGTFLLSSLIFWVICGQKISNIPQFFLSSVAFSSGYNEALTNYSSNPKLLLLCFLFFLTITLIIIIKNIFAMTNASRTETASGLLLGFLELFILFAVWKHAVVSADYYHLNVFLCFSVVSFSTYIYVHHFTHAEEFAVTGEMRTQRHFTWFINCGMLLTVRLCDIFQRKIIRSRRLKFFNRVLSLVNFIGIRLRNVASRAKHRKNALEVAPPSPFGFSLVQMETIIFFIIICFTNNFSQGWHFFIFLPEEITSWNSKLENSVSEMKMPAIENIVGRRIVGYYGELPAPMMYNDFYFKASPATISFVGWNRWIIEKDAEFFRNNDSAPPYLVYQLYNVGDRSIARQFAPQDDPMAQLEIFRRYDPVRDSHGDPVNDLGRLLLKRRDPLSALQYDNLEEGTYLVGDWIQVPKYTSEPIQAVINITRSFFGELVSYVYKPPIYFFCYRLDNGVVGVRKFTPIKATEGFLVAPLILENKDFLSALSAVEWNKYLTRDDSSLRRITEFRISCGYVSIACANRMKVQFNKVYGLGFGRDSSGH